MHRAQQRYARHFAHSFTASSFLLFLFSLSLRERSFPYTYTDLQNFLSRIMAQRLPWLQRERLANTLEKRRLDLLTISSPENLAEGADLSGVCCAFVSARVHPVETPSSYVLEGLLGFLLSEDPAAVGLRRRVVIKVVPMLNPDGVVLGNYRCSTVGQDLNRCVSTPHTPLHPPCLSSLWLTFLNMNEYVSRQKENEYCIIAMVSEWHTCSDALLPFEHTVSY